MDTSPRNAKPRPHSATASEWLTTWSATLLQSGGETIGMLDAGNPTLAGRRNWEKYWSRMSVSSRPTTSETSESARYGCQYPSPAQTGEKENLHWSGRTTTIAPISLEIPYASYAFPSPRWSGGRRGNQLAVHTRVKELLTRRTIDVDLLVIVGREDAGLGEVVQLEVGPRRRICGTRSESGTERLGR